MTMARLVHSRTGSVVVVPDEKAESLILGFGYTEEGAPAKKAAAKTPAKKAAKAPAKKAAAKKSVKKAPAKKAAKSAEPSGESLSTDDLK